MKLLYDVTTDSQMQLSITEYNTKIQILQTCNNKQKYLHKIFNFITLYITVLKKSNFLQTDTRIDTFFYE